MLFQDRRGALYPVAQILRIAPERHDASADGREVTLINGDTCVVTSTVAEQISQVGSVFPALAGTFVLFANGPDKARLVKAPVIGWALGADGGVVPITPDGVNEGMDITLPVLTPDGMVTKAHDQSWPSVDEFLQDQPHLDE